LGNLLKVPVFLCTEIQTKLTEFSLAISVENEKLGEMPQDATAINENDLTKNIILVGFMGCGKSTIGRQVSLQLNYPLIDTDQLIVERMGMSIPEIFEQHGEDHFRSLETALLTQLIEADTEKKVISTGGGLPLRPENREILRKLGYVVWLQAGVDCILERTKSSSHRPLLQTPNPRLTIKNMLADRQVIYSDCADLVINTDDLAIADTTHGIIESARYYFSKS